MLEYRLIEELTVRALNDSVNALLERGWHLNGKLVISASGMFYREMTLKRDDENDSN